MSNNNFIQPFLSNLEEKRKELQSFVDNNIGKANKTIDTIESKVREEKSSPTYDTYNSHPTNVSSSTSVVVDKSDEETSRKIMKGGAIISGATTLIGLITDKDFLKWTGVITGGLTVGYAAYDIYSKETKSHINEYIPLAPKRVSSVSNNDTIHLLPVSNIDYSKLNNQIYLDVEKMHKDVKESWNNFLTTEKEELLKEIRQLDIPVEKTNKMVNEALSRSLISFSLTDVLSKLSDLGQSKNLFEYKKYVEDLRNKYQSVLEGAYNEQAERLGRIEKI